MSVRNVHLKYVKAIALLLVLGGLAGLFAGL